MWIVWTIAALLMVIPASSAPSIGLPLTKTELDSVMGATARDIRLSLRRAADIKYVLDQKTTQDLVDLGYTAGEVAVLKSAYTDLSKLNDIFNGSATQATAYDFRAFAKQVWGTGGGF